MLSILTNLDTLRMTEQPYWLILGKPFWFEFVISSDIYFPQEECFKEHRIIFSKIPTSTAQPSPASFFPTSPFSTQHIICLLFFAFLCPPVITMFVVNSLVTILRAL